MVLAKKTRATATPIQQQQAPLFSTFHLQAIFQHLPCQEVKQLRQISSVMDEAVEETSKSKLPKLSVEVLEIEITVRDPLLYSLHHFPSDKWLLISAQPSICHSGPR